MDENIETVDNPSETIETSPIPDPLPPLPSELPPRDPERLVAEYLRDGNIRRAAIRAGYSLQNYIQSGYRARRILESNRFQTALREVVGHLELVTLARVAREEKGAAAMAAAEKLRSLVEKSAPQPVEKPGKKGKWS